MLDEKKNVASVVILNWNAGKMTCDTIDAVLKQTIAEQLCIIVVDNASTDGSYDLFKEKYGAKIKLIRSSENLGFAGGNNLAFQHCLGKFILLLNNDAIPDPDWAAELIKTAESDDSVGMCTSKIYAGATRERFDNTGQLIYVDGLSRSRGHMEMDVAQYSRVEETLFPSGCASLYSLAAVQRVGGFDQDFFAYGDDTDLGLKIRALGLKCLYTPHAIVNHLQSYTLGAYSLKKVYFIERNRVWIMIKHLPVHWVIISPIYTFLRLFSAYRAGKKRAGLAGEIAKRNSSVQLGLTIIRAWLDALRKAPKMYRKRRELSKMRVISNVAWKEILTRFAASLKNMSFDQ